MMGGTTTEISSLTPSRIGLWRDITSFSKQFIPAKETGFTDLNPEKQVTGSSRTAQAPLFAFRAHQ